MGLGTGGLLVPGAVPMTMPSRASSSSAEPSGPQNPRGKETEPLPMPLCVP